MLAKVSIWVSVHDLPPFPPFGLSAHFKKYGKSVDPNIHFSVFEDLLTDALNIQITHPWNVP
jgi:hypothetical protein